MSEISGACRKASCGNAIPPGLLTQRLCLDHFLDEAFVRTNYALERSQEKRTIDPNGVEQLLADALLIVEHLDGSAHEPAPEQRDRMLELLLILANLHEYVARQPVRIHRLA
jgi:hypothetical protein